MSILANTIWAPGFLYGYDLASVLISVSLGFLTEFAVLRLYTRSVIPAIATLRRLVAANLISFAVGFVLMNVMPFSVPKDSLALTVLAFAIAYMITLAIEFRIMRSLIPEDRRLLFRAVAMANFASYAIHFAVYFLWFGGGFLLSRIFRFLT